MTIAIAGESLQEKQQCAYAKVFEDAMFGEKDSRQLVAGLTDGAKQTHEPESSEDGYSQAAAWAAEPEWNGEASEETAEIVAGRREPEDLIRDLG